MEGLVEKYDALHGWTWKEGETPFSDRKYILAASVIYLVTIFALRYGTPRPIRLKWPMALHNLFLFILSLAMLLGVLSEAFFALRVRLLPVPSCCPCFWSSSAQTKPTKPTGQPTHQPHRLHV
jgi:hypothetical protein